MSRSDILIRVAASGEPCPWVVIDPVSSAARQWCIDCLPDEAVSSPAGVYVLPERAVTACIAAARAEGLRVSAHAPQPQGSAA